MLKTGTKLKDTAPEIKERLCGTIKAPSVCHCHWGKGLFGNYLCTGPCMSRLEILSCSKDYGSRSPHTFLFNDALISLSLKGVKLLGRGWIVGAKVALIMSVQRREYHVTLSLAPPFSNRRIKSQHWLRTCDEKKKVDVKEEIKR